jgi:hypothetical protein
MQRSCGRPASATAEEGLPSKELTVRRIGDRSGAQGLVAYWGQLKQ